MVEIECTGVPGADGVPGAKCDAKRGGKRGADILAGGQGSMRLGPSSGRLAFTPSEPVEAGSVSVLVVETGQDDRYAIMSIASD